MDSPNTHGFTALPPSPCNSTRRKTSHDSNSPEFEFWMVRNPSYPQPNLLSADELFVDGILLPLHLLSNKPSDPPDSDPHPDPGPSKEEPGQAGPELRHVTAELTNGLTSSKRWKDIFKKSSVNAKKVEEKDNKRKEKRCQSGATSAELNINIWPFSRSRSAGNSGTRTRIVTGAPGTRKVSSAPCSRSNSAGESKSRKWPSSSGRPGVHLGRSSPIWQVNRGSGLPKSAVEPAVRSGERVGSKKDTKSSKLMGGGSNNDDNTNNNNKNKARGLNVNVPMCISYRHHLSCRSDENSAIGGGAGGVSSTKSGAAIGGNNNVPNSGNHLFNLRNLFTKKVY